MRSIMNKRHLALILFVIFFSITNLYAIRINGFVRDMNSNDALIGVNIRDSLSHAGTTSNSKGYFSLNIEIPAKLTFSYVGLKSKTITISDTDSLIIVLLETDNNLEELHVIANPIKKSEAIRITSQELMRTPSLGGKPDLIKALQLTPGVQMLSEGLSMMVVRGGEPGQNQYLLDNVPLLYVNHLGGFLSVFNPDMINTADFYRGNFPARFGGKISSVLDITQKTGNSNQRNSSISIGLTDISYSIEGPIIKNKLSYIITSRKTLVDGIIAAITASSNTSPSIISYGFHDINAKISWRPGINDAFNLNIYHGDDYLNHWVKSWQKKDIDKIHHYQIWGNWLVSGQWNKVFKSGLYSDHIISVSRYRNQSGSRSEHEANSTINVLRSKSTSSVKDYSFRSLWRYSVSQNWEIDFGAKAGFYEYIPNNIKTYETEKLTFEKTYHASEFALHVGNKISIGNNTELNLGLRVNSFINDNVVFTEPEPRLGINYQLSKNQNINLNYMRVTQSSHMIFSRSELLKKEVWLPATEQLKPEVAHQYSLNWSGNSKSRSFSAEAGVFLKEMSNLTFLKEGYENLLNITSFENKVLSEGSGISYGFEFHLKKNTGIWTGSCTYVWTESTRKFNEINNGEWYDYEFNRPHSLIISALRTINKKWDMNIVWIAQSGTPYTPAIRKYYSIDTFTGKPKAEIDFGERNSARMQPYLRLDLGFNYNYQTKKGHKAVWSFSLYNALNRINPYDYIYENNDGDINFIIDTDLPVYLYKAGIFSFLPGVSYKVYM